MKTLPIGLICIDGNTPKAYLELLKKYNYQPRTIIYLNQSPKGKKFNILSKVVGNKIASKLVKFKSNLKNKKYKKYRYYFYDKFKLNPNFFSIFNYKKHCVKYFELKTININDPKTIDAIKESGETVFIYGGGGIVKKEVFETGIKIIHTHPGYLPFIRGSHGLYWSILKRQKFGCSTFYMNQGIDMGGVIIRKEYSMSLFPEVDCNEDTKEDLINFYIDPLIRAMTLENIIKKYENFDSLPESLQSKKEGEAFYSMHKKLRTQVIKKYLSRK